MHTFDLVSDQNNIAALGPEKRMDNEVYCYDQLDMLERKVEKNVTINSPSAKPISSASYSVRSTLAQCFATYVNSLSYMSLGLMFTIPAVVIENVKNAKSGLSLNDEQTSWYASLLPISQPFGCFLGGFLQNYIGRKHGLLFTNVSTVSAWILLHEATSVEMLYVSSALMGISVGFAEAPCVMYVSEITTPKLRGTLVMYNNSNVNFGVALTFLLASFMTWKTMSLVCMGLSVFSVLMLLFIPESPVWLINKGKANEAIKALRWLRGWVPQTDVMAEFEELSQYIQRTHSNNSTSQHSDTISLENRSFKMIYLLDSRTLRPLIFLLCYSPFAYFASLLPAMDYYLVIFNSMNLPMRSKWLGFLCATAAFVGCIVSAATVKIFGKRILSLVSMTTSSVLSLLLSLYMIFQNEWYQPWIFILLFIALGFTQAVGINTLPWVLIGEVYPVKTRSVAAGITGAAFYVYLSIFTKTYYYLELLMTTQGTFLLYSILGFVGVVYLWLFMPETEGKTMVEIDELFADDARRSCPHFRKKK